MDETKLRTIAQLQEFLDATPEVSFSGAAGDGDAQRVTGCIDARKYGGDRETSSAGIISVTQIVCWTPWGLESRIQSYPIQSNPIQ